MRKTTRRLLSVILAFAMLFQLGVTAFATDTGSEAVTDETNTLSEEATATEDTVAPSEDATEEDGEEKLFYLQPDKKTISEKDSGVVRVKIARTGSTAEAASVVLKLVDVTAHYEENYTAYIEGEDIEPYAEFGRVSIVDFNIENADTTYEEEIPDEEDIANALSEAGGADILDSEGNVIGRTTVSDGSEDEEVEIFETESTTPVSSGDPSSVNETNPLKEARNQYTGTVSDRQVMESDITDYGILDNTTPDDGIYTNNDGAETELYGEIVQDDFPGAEYLLEFEEGEAEKYLIIKPSYSSKNEGDSMVMCMLKEASPGTLLNGEKGMEYITITDEDGPAVATISLKDDFIIADDGKAYIEVTREGAINNVVYATIYTVPGSAETGKDFSGVSAKLHFPMGISSRFVEIPVGHGDSEKEFYVKLNSPVGCEIKNNSTLVRIVKESDMNKYSNGLLTDASLMEDGYTENTLVDSGMLGTPFNLNATSLYGNVSRQPDGSILMSGIDRPNDTYQLTELIDDSLSYLYDGVRIKWSQTHNGLISYGHAHIDQITIDSLGRRNDIPLDKITTNKFKRIDDYFFGNTEYAQGFTVYTITTSWHGRKLSLHQLTPIKREFTFNLLPAKTPEEGGLNFIGCTPEEIAKYQNVILNSSISDAKCTVKSNESFSVSATGKEYAKFTGIEFVAPGKDPYFVPVSKDSRTVTIAVDATLVKHLATNGYVTFTSNPKIHEKSYKGNLNIRPVFEYIDANVEFLHSSRGHFEGYETNGSNKLVTDTFHMGDKLDLKGVVEPSLEHDLKATGISFIEKTEKNAPITKSRGDILYVNDETSRLFTITDYYTSLQPTFAKKETNTIIVVSDADLGYFNTEAGIFATAIGQERDEKGNHLFYISTGQSSRDFLYLIAEPKDPGHIPLWKEENGAETFSGKMFYFSPDLHKENNYLYLTVGTNTSANAYYKLSGYADAPSVNLSTGHFSNEKEYPAADALISAGGMGAFSDAEGIFKLNPVYAVGGSTVRYIVSYNGISEIKDFKVPSSSLPTKSVTYKDWNGQKYETKTVNAIPVEMGVVRISGHSSAGVHFSGIDVMQGNRYILGAQILEMNGLETKLSVTVSDGHKYIFDNTTYSENVTEVTFMFVDGLTGRTKSRYAAAREGDTNRWSVTLPELTPDSPEKYTYGDVLYVQMKTDKKLFTDDELASFGENAPVMTYNPVSTGFAVISDTDYEPKLLDFEVPLKPEDLIGRDASYGMFPFIGEVKFAIKVVGALKKTMGADDVAEAMIDDLLNMPGNDPALASLSSGRASTTGKVHISIAFRFIDLPYGGTRIAMGVAGTMGNDTFERRLSPYTNAVNAKDRFVQLTTHVNFQSKGKSLGEAINSVNSVMGGTAFSFSFYLGVYLDFGFLHITEHEAGNTSSLSYSLVFLGGGGFVGGSITVDGMKPLLVPPGIPCYGGFVATATLSDFFGYGKNPAITLESVKNEDNLDTKSYECYNEIFGTASLNLYAGIGLANIVGLRLSLGAAVELGYSPKMEAWYPSVSSKWGMNLLANVAGEVNLIFLNIPLANFTFPLWSGGFYDYFKEIRTANGLIEILEENVTKIIKAGKKPQYEEALTVIDQKTAELRAEIKNNNSSAASVKKLADDLREYAYDAGIVTGFDYFKSKSTIVGGIVPALFAETPEDKEGYYIRDHVESKWVANETPELQSAFSAVSSMPIVMDGYANPSTKLLPIGDNKILMVYIGDDNTRPEIQAAALMYSIYDATSNTWTDPVMIQEDGTADSAPNLCDAGDNVMISWVSTNADKVINSDNPVDHYEQYDIFTVLFNKDDYSLGTIEQITDDAFCDGAPQGTYDPITGDRQIFYVKSSPTTSVGFESKTDQLLSFINPNATYSVLCYMLYDNSQGRWATDYYYEEEISKSDFNGDEDAYNEYVATWKGQRILPSATDTQTDPLITDLNVCASYNGLAVYAFTVDTDNDPDTFDDRELYAQFYDFAKHTTYVPVRITRDNVCQSQPQLIRNENSTILFWLDDNSKVKYINLTDAIKGVRVGENEYESVINPDGTIREGYTLDVHTVDAESSYDGESVAAIVDYRVLTDDEDNLYVIWTRPVLTEAYSNSEEVNPLPPMEIYATAKIKDGEKITIEEGEFARGGKWSKPYRLTYSEKLNDGLAVSLSDDGDLILAHNQYTMEYVGFDPEYFKDYKIKTEIDANGNEQKVLEGQLYKTSPINLMLTKCTPCGSLEIADFVLSDLVPEGGDTITVAAIIENIGLTTARGYEARFYEYRDGQKGEQIAAFDSDESIVVNTTIAHAFDWELPDDIEGLSLFAEITEKSDDGNYEPFTTVTDPFVLTSDCEVDLWFITQKKEKFEVSFEVYNAGNAPTEEGHTANVHLVGLYGDIAEDYGLESNILATVNASGIEPGDSEFYTLEVTIPGTVFETCGFDALEISVKDKNSAIVANSNTEFVSIQQPMDFMLNEEKDISLRMGDTFELSYSYNGGQFIKVAESVIYTIEDPDIAVITDGVLTAVNPGRTTVTATILPYGTTSTVELTVSAKSSSGGSSGLIGGGSSDSAPAEKPDEKPDGEATTTTTTDDATGTVTTVTTNKDGSVTTTETRKDGTVITTATDSTGKTTAEIKAEAEVTAELPVAANANVLMVLLTDATGKTTYITDAERTEKGVKVTADGNTKVEVITGARKTFSDVHPQGHWATDAIDFVSALGLMKGTSDVTFAPNDKLTRAMLVTILYRKCGEPSVSASSAFTDVKAGSYYEKAVIWASENGIVNGTSAVTFAPDAFITREQAAAMLQRFAKYESTENPEHSDTNLLSYDDFESISEWAISAMQWANGAGIIKGRTATTLVPGGTLTRAEAAQILLNYLKN